MSCSCSGPSWCTRRRGVHRAAGPVAGGAARVGARRDRARRPRVPEHPGRHRRGGRPARGDGGLRRGADRQSPDGHAGPDRRRGVPAVVGRAAVRGADAGRVPPGLQPGAAELPGHPDADRDGARQAHRRALPAVRGLLRDHQQHAAVRRVGRGGDQLRRLHHPRLGRVRRADPVRAVPLPVRHPRVGQRRLQGPHARPA